MSELRPADAKIELPRCPDCGEEVACGARLGQERCWCMDSPPLERDPALPADACLCPRCLARRLEAQGKA